MKLETSNELCIFCKKKYKKTFNNIICENNEAYVVLDNAPANPGHLLIISKDHYESWFSVPLEKQYAIMELLNKAKEWLDVTFNPDGYNIGLNCGLDAGQTVFHMHMHLIPRYKGDVDSPEGGIKKILTKKD